MTIIIVMEKKIKSKHDTFMRQYKDDLSKDILSIIGKEEITDEIKKNLEDYLQLLYDYDTSIYSENDFKKKKRVRNVVKCDERCKAKRANGEQCTRRKKNNDYCGTHMKGLPHGEINYTGVEKKKAQTIKAWEQEINGIIYFIDNNNNVYNTYDILERKDNPNIINQYTSVYDKDKDKMIFALVN